MVLKVFVGSVTKNDSEARQFDPSLYFLGIVSIVPNMPYNALTLIPTNARVNASPET